MDGGAAFLEVQFPFSDPTADGPHIQVACDLALQAGFTRERGFALVAALRAYTDIPIAVMSYAIRSSRTASPASCSVAGTPAPTP